MTYMKQEKGRRELEIRGRIGTVLTTVLLRSPKIHTILIRYDLLLNHKTKQTKKQKKKTTKKKKKLKRITSCQATRPYINQQQQQKRVTIISIVIGIFGKVTKGWLVGWLGFMAYQPM